MGKAGRGDDAYRADYEGRQWTIRNYENNLLVDVTECCMVRIKRELIKLKESE